MRDSLSTRIKNAMNAPATEEVVVMLLTISHPDLEDGDLYFSNDNKTLFDAELMLAGTLSQGLQFAYLPMQLTLPDEGEGASDTINITIDSVSRQATPLLRSTTTPASVKIQVALAATPDVIEMSFDNFELMSAEVDAGKAVLTLQVDSMASEPCPADNFTPSTFGGLWSTT